MEAIVEKYNGPLVKTTEDVVKKCVNQELVILTMLRPEPPRSRLAARPAAAKRFCQGQRKTVQSSCGTCHPGSRSPMPDGSGACCIRSHIG